MSIKSPSVFALIFALSFSSALNAQAPKPTASKETSNPTIPQEGKKPRESDGKIDFAHEVVPILRKHCVACHGGKEAKGGFSLNSRALLLESESVEVGNADGSRLVELVESADPEDQMPPKDRPRLAAAEIMKLRAWIDQELRWEPGYSFAEEQYEPPLRPRRPALPPAVGGNNHPIDRLLAAYSRKNGLQPLAPIDDATFARRVSLDVVGLLPEPQALQSYLADTAPNKRERFIDQLLDDEIGYAEHWLSFWNDLLRNDYSGTGFITGGRKQISAWLYKSLLENKPYDQMVGELIAPSDASDGFIRGIRWRGNVSASQRQEVQFAQNVGQAFLGINLKCASCHDSFIDRWTLAETYGLAQIYATEQLELHRCEKPTGRLAKAAWLFPELGSVNPQASQPERLQQLARLLTHKQNGRFTRTMVNRIWHRFMGRGLVHPVDAMHTKPWDADLLDYLATRFADDKYDLKRIIRLICTSEAYQSASPALEETTEDEPYVFRGPLPRRMTAEQFMDAVWLVTGAAPSKYDAPVQRIPVSKQSDTNETVAKATRTARWIWSSSASDGKTPQGGEAVTFRQEFLLGDVPSRAFAVLTCDNEYSLYLNGRRVAADSNWESVEAVDLLPHLRKGKNLLLIVARNAGNGPNPAGLICEVRMTGPDDRNTTLATDTSWEWTSALPDRRGRFKTLPDDWQPATRIEKVVWDGRVGASILSALQSPETSPLRMVRASLVKNTAFLKALGRPNRDQIVTSRPTALTTLEAIDLANGQDLSDAIAIGAERQLARHPAPRTLVDKLFQFTLSRSPTDDELQVTSSLLGVAPTEEQVEDLLWSVFMLPEFQLIR